MTPLQNDLAVYRAVCDAWESDSEYRARVNETPREALASKGMDIPAGLEVRVHANDDETRYFVFPVDPNETLSDTILETVHGGTPASSASSVGSSSSVGTIPSCLSSAGTASSIGSAGSS